MTVQVSDIDFTCLCIDAHTSGVGELSLAVSARTEGTTVLKIASSGEQRDALIAVSHIQQCFLHTKNKHQMKKT